MPEPTTVSLYEAKTHLSELGERAASGEEIIVTKHGKPRFRLVSASVRSARPRPGSVRLALAPGTRAALLAFDWAAPDEDIERDFGVRG